jgi:hypothetical protein
MRVVLDWDDTLYPTTTFQRHRPCPMLMVQHDKCVADFLKQCAECADVVDIVTAASFGWIDSCTTWMPLTRGVMRRHRVQVTSARDQFDDLKKWFDGSKWSAPSGLADHAYAKTLACAYLSVTHPVPRFVSDPTAVFSVGDQPWDRRAVHTAFLGVGPPARASWNAYSLCTFYEHVLLPHTPSQFPSSSEWSVLHAWCASGMDAPRTMCMLEDLRTFLPSTVAKMARGIPTPDLLYSPPRGAHPSWPL